MTLRFRLAAITILLFVVGGCVYAVYDARTAVRRPAPIIGMVRRTEVRVAAELTGRLAKFLVKPGAHVDEGQEVAELDAPDLAASLVQAQASAASTGADRANLYAGVRSEEQQIANKQIEVAAANLDFDKEELDRTRALAAKGFAPGERLDRATASYDSDNAALQLKKAAYAEAVAGPTAEQREIADARLAQAKATAKTVEKRLSKTRLLSPVSGVVKTSIGEPGEIVRTGETILTLVPDARPWFAFTAREEKLEGVSIGAELAVLRSDGKTTVARLTELRPLGQFATWQAARAIGDHDLNSFYLRLEPTSDADDDLEPGMSVWLLQPGTAKF
jgi:multidrug resistance efflux pump